MGKESLAIDISPLSVKAMQERGLNALHVNLFDEHFTGQFDTILMLMNGWNYWKVEEYSCFLCKNEAVTGSVDVSC